MAIKSKAQIQAESNSTYIDNSVGSITPTSVRSLNTDWIDSIIFAEATASLNVFSATSASFATSASRADSAATASFLTGTVASASFAIQAGTASFLLGSVESASFATSASRAISAATATSASYSLTSSLAQRNLITASAAANILTFTKGDGTTFNVSIAQSGSVQSASFADTANQANSASLAANSLLLQGTGSNGFATTASLTAVSSSNQQLSASYIALSGSYNTFSGSASTRITNTSQSLQAVSASTQQVSASYIALSGSYNVFSGSASTRITNLESFSSSLDATFATDAQLNAATQSLSASTSTVNTRVTEVSSSLLQVSASYIALSASYNASSGSTSIRTTTLESTASALVAASASFSTRVSNNTSNIQTLTSATASYAVLGNNQTFTGTNAFNNAVTMSNVRVTGTASIAFLDVTFQSSSIIYSSGSNQFGDASNDTQTLWGTVDIISGPLVVTGSANFKETITGSISGNAATATSSTSASYAFTASSAISASFASVAASVLGTITSASYAYTASSAVNSTNALTASSTPNAFVSAQNGMINGSIQLNKGDLSATTITINNVESASFADTALSASFATNATSASNSTLLSGMPSSSFATTGSNLFKGNQTITGSNFLQQGGVFSIYNNDGTTAFVLSTPAQLAQIQVPFTASSGINANIQGNLVGTASYADNATSASFAQTASFVLNATPAFPFTGSAEISGSLAITGSLTVTGSSLFSGPISGSNLTLTNSGSILLFSSAANNRGIQNMLISDSGSRNNIISIAQTDAANTGSFVVSGSGNLITITGISNSSVNTGALFGVTGDRAIITVMPSLTGSNATKTFPTITTSTANSTMLIFDNRVSETNRAINISNSNINSTITANIASGSIGILNSGINGTTLTLIDSGSGTSAGNAFIQNSTICATATNIVFAPTSSGQSQLATSLIVGATNRLLMTGSSSGGGTAVAGPNVLDSMLVGHRLIVTGSSASNAVVPIALVGSFNLANGLLNDGRFTRFAVGTGTADSLRRTSFHVSASGLTTIFDGLVVSGSMVAQAISSSFSGSGANIFGVVSASYAYTASSAVISLSSSYSDNSNTANSATSATSASYAYTASSAISAGTASYATNFIISGSLNVTATSDFSGGDFKVTDQERNAEFDVDYFKIKTQKGTQITGSLNLTGSLVGQPVSQSVSSLTASLNLAAGNFFNLTLPASANTYITASGQVAGQTINLKITQQATTGSVTLGAGFKQVSGSAYTVTATANAVDIVTFISFDNTGLYVSNVKNLI